MAASIVVFRVDFADLFSVILLGRLIPTIRLTSRNLWPINSNSTKVTQVAAIISKLLFHFIHLPLAVAVFRHSDSI